jgi:hypothetical protein
MPVTHPSGLPNAYDRLADGATGADVARLVFQENAFIEGANLNEMQTIAQRNIQRVGSLVARNGDRIEGADIVFDEANTQAILSAGTIYIAGDVRPVAAATIAGIAATGEFQIGVRLQKTNETYLDNPSLLGLSPGSEAEDEPTASWQREKLVWSRFGDGQPGEFYTVYQIKDGTVIDQSPPPSLSGINAAIGVYDRAANGSYIVKGCEVVPLGKFSNEQVFTIAEGEANIDGFKRIRETALRHAEPEQPDLETISAEPLPFTAATGGTMTFTVARPPIAAIQSVVLVKQIAENIVRGVSPGGLDALTKPSVVAIVSVTQGATTYVAGTDYVQAGDLLSWSPGGAEPAAGSTYAVTYRFNEAATPSAVTDTTLQATGGVNGTTALISYTSKLPRTDILCLDGAGRSAYVKGISARRDPQPPQTPSSLLKLAEIRNTWLGTAAVVNNGTRNFTYDAQRRFFDRLIDVLTQFDRQNQRTAIIERDPVSKRGIFTDTFLDDFYRDAGAPQTLATTGASLTLATDLIGVQNLNTTTETLAYTEEVILRQELAPSAMRINPFANFSPFPAGLKIEPAVDFWTEQQTVWLSPVTQEFTAAPRVPPGTTTISETVAETQVRAAFLRQIPIAVTLEGFGVGENLATLTFDGVNVKPAGTQTANASGIITLTFTIPANMPAGRRLVQATGAAGSFAEAIFVGEGTIDVSTMRRVNLVTRAAPPPPAVIAPQARQPGDFSNRNSDPLAQSFAVAETRQVVGFDFRLAAKGSPSKGLRVQLCPLVNGLPGAEILAETFVSMVTPNVGDWISARFPIPVTLSPNQMYCFIILTDDPVHALSISRLGDIDTVTQQRVSSQPYTVGDLFASSNRISWVVVPDADLTFRVVAARYTAVSRTIVLWSGTWTGVSDFQVRATVDIPDQSCSIRLELVRASGAVLSFAANQQIALDAFVSEAITIRAVMSGTDRLSPILFSFAQLFTGAIRTTGTYITRVFPMGTAVTVRALFAALLPAGSSVSVDVDAANNTWASMTLGATAVLGSGWTEPEYSRSAYTATQGRIRITLNGTPAARPSLALLRAFSI